MRGIQRREVLKRLGAAPVAAGFALSEARAQRAHEHVHRAAGGGTDAPPWERRFFSDGEWAVVALLCDLILPADDRSGSATEAKVPEFIDFTLTDELVEAREREEMQTAVRGGLAWLERECRGRFTRSFAECTDGERREVLDEIAWPERAVPEGSQGVAFFNLFRDLVASGFWTSRIGMDDIGYRGNTFVAEWTGCPPEVLDKLGLKTARGSGSRRRGTARGGGDRRGTVPPRASRRT
ncbi:MAG: gluconate 2-dehydrogenase subunit 3 family protein [Acidobacteria bacterium]|nr:gluconate 2-dehydrogenase subunit 3 family protein [Acidobacteriota bacterium]